MDKAGENTEVSSVAKIGLFEGGEKGAQWPGKLSDGYPVFKVRVLSKKTKTNSSVDRKQTRKI